MKNKHSLILMMRRCEKLEDVQRFLFDDVFKKENVNKLGIK